MYILYYIIMAFLVSEKTCYSVTVVTLPLGESGKKRATTGVAALMVSRIGVGLPRLLCLIGFQEREGDTGGADTGASAGHLHRG